MKNNLISFLQVNWALRTHYGYSLIELDDLIPFEIDEYVRLTREWVEEKKAREKQ